MRHSLITAVFVLSTVGCATPPGPGSVATPADEARVQVESAERAFARSMAERDHAAFTSFLSDDAMFFSGEVAFRGRQAVADGWKPFFDGETAPFSWEPERVEVLDSGLLALSSGPVFGADGEQLGTFTSIWREESPGEWRVVFDTGCD